MITEMIKLGQVSTKKQGETKSATVVIQ